MTLAKFPLGAGPLGFDPVAPGSPAAVRQPGVPLIHPSSHDAVPLPDGTLYLVHPVDQAVSLALGVRAGTVGSASSVGHLLRDLEYADAALEVRVRQRVEQALARLTARRDITLLSVVTTRIPGGFVVDISYRNLRVLPATDVPVQLTSS